MWNETLQELLTTDVQNLKSHKHVKDMIRRWGLHDDINIPFSDEDNRYRVNHLGMLQEPDQLAQALIFMSDKPVSTYLEIGSFHGATFGFISAYLFRFNPDLKATAVDITRDIDYLLANTLGQHFPVSFIKGTSADVKRPFDLVFIDADHKYDSVKQDYENVGLQAKYCMMHDVDDQFLIAERDESGSIKFWKELKKNNPTVEFINQRHFMGIGIRL